MGHPNLCYRCGGRWHQKQLRYEHQVRNHPQPCKSPDIRRYFVRLLFKELGPSYRQRLWCSSNSTISKPVRIANVGAISDAGGINVRFRPEADISEAVIL